MNNAVLGLIRLLAGLAMGVAGLFGGALLGDMIGQSIGVRQRMPAPEAMAWEGVVIGAFVGLIAGVVLGQSLALVLLRGFLPTDGKPATLQEDNSNTDDASL